MPILLQLANRSDFAVRTLGRCGPAAEQAIPWLEAAISRMRGDAEHSLEPRSAEWKLIDTGLAAAVALSQIRQDVSTVLPMLVDMLSDKSPFTRGRAASVLGTLGPAGHDALPALRVRIDDSDRNVRRCASRAIGWIEDGAEHRPAKPPPMRPSGHTRFSFFVWPLSRGF